VIVADVDRAGDIMGGAAFRGDPPVQALPQMADHERPLRLAQRQVKAEQFGRFIGQVIIDRHGPAAVDTGQRPRRVGLFRGPDDKGVTGPEYFPFLPVYRKRCSAGLPYECQNTAPGFVFGNVRVLSRLSVDLPPDYEKSSPRHDFFFNDFKLSLLFYC
jgi:hypothetical protein